MPSPDVLRDYQQILPDAPERILAMAEADTTARVAIDEKLADAEATGAAQGRVYAASLTILAFIAAFILGMFGHTAIAIAFVSPGLATLVGAMIGGRRSE